MAFVISMPSTFKVGDTAECRINREPALVTWRDKDTLVIAPDDARRIVFMRRDRDLIDFACTDADGTAPYISVPVPHR